MGEQMCAMVRKDQWPVLLTLTPPIAGYCGWYDASRITGQDDNTPLSTWPNLAASSFVMTQPTPAACPTYYSSTPGKTVNGKPAVWFDGVDSMMGTSPPILTTVGPFTIFSVTQCPTSGTQYAFLNGKNNYSGFAGLITNDPAPPGMALLFGAVAWNAVGSEPTAGIPHTYSVSFSGVANDTITATVDGVVSTVAAAGTYGAARPIDMSSLGGAAELAYARHNGAICEVIVYPTVLAANDVTVMNDHLKAKWGTP